MLAVWDVRAEFYEKSGCCFFPMRIQKKKKLNGFLNFNHPLYSLHLAHCDYFTVLKF